MKLYEAVEDYDGETARIFWAKDRTVVLRFLAQEWKTWQRKLNSPLLFDYNYYMINEVETDHLPIKNSFHQEHRLKVLRDIGYSYEESLYCEKCQKYDIGVKACEDCGICQDCGTLIDDLCVQCHKRFCK